MRRAGESTDRGLQALGERGLDVVRSSSTARASKKIRVRGDPLDQQAGPLGDVAPPLKERGNVGRDALSRRRSHPS